jgi:hypothetical protein
LRSIFVAIHHRHIRADKTERLPGDHETTSLRGNKSGIGLAGIIAGGITPKEESRAQNNRERGD